jgi:hypothetical protein
MGRDGSRRLHVRRATAARQEKDSVSKNATGSMTTTVQTFKTLLLQGFAARSDALADLSGSPRKWGNGGTADHRTLKLSGCFAVIRLAISAGAPTPAPCKGWLLPDALGRQSTSAHARCSAAPRSGLLAANWQQTTRAVCQNLTQPLNARPPALGQTSFLRKIIIVRDPGMRLSAHDLITRIARRSPGGSGAFDTARISK